MLHNDELTALVRSNDWLKTSIREGNMNSIIKSFNFMPGEYITISDFRKIIDRLVSEYKSGLIYVADMQRRSEELIKSGDI